MLLSKWVCMFCMWVVGDQTVILCTRDSVFTYLGEQVALLIALTWSLNKHLFI